jgi:hypothetical protein
MGETSMKNAMIGGLTALFATGYILAHSASAQPLTPFANYQAGAVTLVGWGDNGQGGGYGGTPQNQGSGYGGGQQNQGGGWQGGQPQNQGGTYNNNGGNQGGTYNKNSGNQGGDYSGGNNSQPQGDYQGQQQPQGGNGGQPQQGGNSGQQPSGGSEPTGNAGDNTACLANCNKQCMNDFVPGSAKQKTCSGRCNRVCRLH